MFKTFVAVLSLGLISTISSSQVNGFEKNLGQIIDNSPQEEGEILYRLIQGDARIYFYKDHIAYYFYKSNKRDNWKNIHIENLDAEQIKRKRLNDTTWVYRLDLDLYNAQTKSVKGGSEKNFHANYFLAHCPDGISNVSFYTDIIYDDVYPGIDFRFSLSDKGLKYDIHAKAGADLGQIKLKYNGYEGVHLKENRLILQTPFGEMTESLPASFQLSDQNNPFLSGNNTGEKVDVQYNLSENGVISFFEEGTISNNILIDPELIWSTYYNYDDGSVFGQELDAANGTLVSVSSTDDGLMPSLNPGGSAYYQGELDTTGGILEPDLRILKFTTDGVLEWATYYGGTGPEFVKGGVKINPANGDIFIAAISTSMDFPTEDLGGGAWFESTNATTEQQIVFLRFTSAGERLWATYFNSNLSASCYDLDVTNTGELYVVGDNEAGNTIPTQFLAGAYNQSTPSSGGAIDKDGILLSFTGTGVFKWGTYFGTDNGGVAINESFRKIEIAPNGKIYIAGLVDAASTITQNASGYFDNGHNGGEDILITRFSAAGTLDWSTYFGGSVDEMNLHGLSIDSANNIYVSGVTKSSDYPTFDPGNGGYFDNTLNGTQSGFIAKFDYKTDLVWSTYFGSPNNEYMTTLDVSPNAMVYLSTYTDGTTGMPVLDKTNAYYEATGNGPLNGFIAQFDTSGVQEWGTYVSSGGATAYHAIITYDGQCGDQVYVTGTQSTAGYPVQNPGGGAYNQSYNGSGVDKFIISEFEEDFLDPGWTAPTTLCSNSPLFNLNGALTGDLGGIWTGQGVTGTNFDPSIPNADTVLVTYTLGTTPCIDSLQLPIVINQASVIPNGINGTDSICPGSSSILTISGGQLGGGADWYWYQGSCGNNFIATGDTLIVSPTSTTTYYARAEGACNITSCVAYTVTVKTNSTAATGINVSVDPVCPGDSSMLSVTGGTLGTGAAWNWYQGACNGTLLGTGDSITVYPTSLTNYYVNAVGDCNTTVCQAVSISTAQNSTVPTGISANDTILCAGSFTNLSVVGGSLGTTAGWVWYENTCGGINIGTGPNITVTPAATTTYFVRSEGYCGNGACVQITIEVHNFSTAPVSVSTDINPVCIGDTANLTINGGSLGTGADWIWYEGSCGGIVVDTGSTIPVSPPGVTTYFVRAENICNATTCEQITINTTPGGDASWTSPGTICESSGIIDLDDFITGNTGGIWSGTNVSGSNFNPAGLSGQIISISYTEGNVSCQDINMQTISVAQTVNASWASPGNVCEGNGLVDLDQFVTGSSGGTWSGAGITGSMFDPSGLTGPVNIEYMVGVAPSCIDSSELQITVIQGPGIPIVSVTDTTICEGDTTTIMASGSGTQVDYHVYDAATGGNLLGDTDLPLTPVTNTTYYIQAEDINGCFHPGALVSIDISVIPAPLANAGIDQTICEGDMITLTATGGTDFLWSTGETTASIDVTPLQDTTYGVEVSNTSTLCMAVDSVTITVVNNEDINAEDDAYTVVSDESTTLTVMSNDTNGDPGTLQIASQPDNGSAIVSGNSIIYTGSGDYGGNDTIVYILCHPQCALKCDTGMVRLFITTSLEALPPTGFSPNGDGINDAFVILGLENYPQAELSVFNRWGEMVYYAQPYNNNWQGESNGKRTLGGEQVPDGTYFYVLRLGESFENIHGHVEVKRQ